jgi:hypothetical protein
VVDLHGTNVLSNEATFTNRFEPGPHVFTLLVSDGVLVSTQTVTVEIITAVAAVEFLRERVELAIPDRPEQVPLVNWLREAAKAFETCKVDQGVRFLEMFQDRVRDRVAPADPELGAHLIQTAQSIIAAARDSDPDAGANRPDHPKKDDDEDRNAKPDREAGDDSVQKQN